MKSLIQLFNDWEIQLLVLLSFTLQLFLFFVSSLRWHWTNMFLRFTIWMAYLGADLVAVYALGYLSRHVGSTTAGRDTLRVAQPLAFFWAPFLLIHLGWQDTITAFSMEDNNLWLRHSLNMVVQVVLAIYIFWKSIGRHNLELLMSGIFVFVAGVIKYGERIWSLKCGSMESLESSTGNQYMHQLAQSVDMGAGYSRVVCTGLRSMQGVLEVFTSRSSGIDINESMMLDRVEMFNLVGFELSMLHNDLYTKAVVLRTRAGTVLRCICQITVIIAFVTFLGAGNKKSYRRADTAVTYSLFIGGFVLELCAMFISLRSPWTWLWLKARGWNKLARLSRFLFSNGAIIGRPEKRSLRRIVVGQYNLKGWLVHGEQTRSFFSRHGLMLTVRKSLTLFGAQEEKIFWLSKTLGREYAKGDKIMELLRRRLPPVDMIGRQAGSLWPLQLDLIFRRFIDETGVPITNTRDFGTIIVMLHIATEALLGSSDVECSNVSEEVCRQLSRYMMYLLVTHPSLLPLDTSAVATLQTWRAVASIDGLIRTFEGIVIDHYPSAEATLEEFEAYWIQIIIYVAAKSRPEMHTALLARGEELLTFVLLLLAHHEIGDRSNLFWYRNIHHREYGDMTGNSPIYVSLMT